MTPVFDMRCRENGIARRLTGVKHPWTNRQVEQMNRTIKEAPQDAPVKRYHDDSQQLFERHLADLINADNYARRLKILKNLTPYEYVSKIWTGEPTWFTLSPIH